MKWRLAHGEDKRTDLLVIILGLFVIFGGVYESVDMVVGDGGIYKAPIIDYIPAILCCIMFHWLLGVYSVNPNGIIVISLLSWRRIKWTKIQAARIYSIYRKYQDTGKYMFCILDPKKPMSSLNWDSLVLPHPNWVCFRITDNRLKEFQEYCVIPVEQGKQDGPKSLI